jgi:hypothetical protein
MMSILADKRTKVLTQGMTGAADIIKIAMELSLA